MDGLPGTSRLDNPLRNPSSQGAIGSDLDRLVLHGFVAKKQNIEAR